MWRLASFVEKESQFKNKSCIRNISLPFVNINLNIMFRNDNCVCWCEQFICNRLDLRKMFIIHCLPWLPACTFWDVTSYYSSLMTFFVDVWCELILSVHILKCQPWLVSQDVKAKQCPFLIPINTITNTYSFTTHYTDCLYWPTASPVCKPEILLSHPHLLLSSSISVFSHLCLVECTCIHEQVGWGSCHVLVFWFVTFVPCHCPSNQQCLFCQSTAQSRNWYMKQLARSLHLKLQQSFHIFKVEVSLWKGAVKGFCDEAIEGCCSSTEIFSSKGLPVIKLFLLDWSGL